MVQGGGPGAYRTGLLLGLLLLMLLILPGNGNEGSKAGNCYCMKTFSSNSPPTADQLKALRKRLEEYNQCFGYARFRLRPRSSSQPKLYSVCGGSQDPWVLDLISCYEKKECGHHSQSQSMARQEHLLPPNHQVPESTEKTSWNTSTPTQTAPSPTLQSTQQPTLPSTQQPTLPAATPSFEKNFTHNSETTTSTVGPSLHAALEIREQEKGNKGSAAGASALVAVPSLLGIVFILTIIILYLKCKKQKSRHDSPDLELPLAPDSTA
ncbi:C-X-C motif chemokine 16 [Sorex araneus]|uniref:C-X-C motif chemokine 16 n=1 Tax=Sorex araneus TaxID=42254 RepID=UPI0003315173|nr:C-X-C motif chemokine 16 [Sorex araneus]